MSARRGPPLHPNHFTRPHFYSRLPPTQAFNTPLPHNSDSDDDGAAPFRLYKGLRDETILSRCIRYDQFTPCNDRAFMLRQCALGVLWVLSECSLSVLVQHTQRTLIQHSGNTQGKLREPSGHTQQTHREHSEHIQRTPREHPGNTQRKLREHSGDTQQTRREH